MAQVIDSTTNPFGGVLLKPAALPNDPEEFRQQLQSSLSFWRHQGLQLVWLEVPITKASLIPVAVEKGFSFHHTGQDYLILTYRLVENTFVPPYATHYIGAGGVVLTPEQDLLVVSERHRATKAPFFKLPGGTLHPGEHLVDGVIREILEETGVQTRFESLVCLRHWHGYRHGKSDIYFVSRLTPLNREITMQTNEIDDCRWMPVGDYLGSDKVSIFNKEIVKAAIQNSGMVRVSIQGFVDPEMREFFMPPETGSEITTEKKV